MTDPARSSDAQNTQSDAQDSLRGCDPQASMKIVVPEDLLVHISLERMPESAKVRGTITDTQNVKVANSSVRVKSSGTDARIERAPIGEYSIENLQAGKYDFIACRLPFRPDLHLRGRLAPDEVKTINFVLKDPPSIAPKVTLTLAGFRAAAVDGVVYRKEPTSGCLVAQAFPNDKGEVEFAKWHQEIRSAFANAIPEETARNTYAPPP